MEIKVINVEEMQKMFGCHFDIEDNLVNRITQ
jgi:hypothetical protein